LRFSIIIPRRNSGKALKKCLDSVYRSDFKDFKVAIIAKSSWPSPCPENPKLPPCRLQCPRQGQSSNQERGRESRQIHDPPSALSQPPIIEEELSYVPSKGRVEMIRKVYAVDPLCCTSCGGRMRVIAFIEDHNE
jgi:hypothetical protein